MTTMVMVLRILYENDGDGDSDRDNVYSHNDDGNDDGWWR